MATERRSTKQKRTLVAGGGAVAVVLVAGSMLAWANGAFGTPAVDRVGSFHEIQAQLVTTTQARATTHTRSSTSHASSTSRPTGAVGTTRPTAPNDEPERTNAPQSVAPTDGGATIEPHDSPEYSTSSVESESSASGAHVTTSSRPLSDDEVEPPDDRGSDD